MKTLESNRTSKRKLMIALLVFLLVAVIAMVVYREVNYARAVQIKGTVVDIQWNTGNHQLPKFVILDAANNKIEISHYTVTLGPSVVKIGDKLEKKQGDNFCIINGQDIRFSSY
jgi:hypothetical protein